jgi:pyridoxine 5-phosphate synthase
MRLGVNIDHVATLRQVRRAAEPDPLEAALLAERGGADSIVCHLREDRRHIQDLDLRRVRERVRVLNLEMALVDDIIRIALETRPDQVTIVPEKRQEVTTEGGLDLLAVRDRLPGVVEQFRARAIGVSLFIDPEPAQVEAAKASGAGIVEFHTGTYAEAAGSEASRKALLHLEEACGQAKALGLSVAAGHGLTYANVRPVVSIPEIEELNIGHTLVSRAVMAGMEQAVREMKKLMRR